MLDNNSSVEELKRAEEKMCDGALTAFRRAVREISRSAKLQAFNKNEEILKYFDGDYQTVSPPLVPPLRPWTPHATLPPRVRLQPPPPGQQRAELTLGIRGRRRSRRPTHRR